MLIHSYLWFTRFSFFLFSFLTSLNLFTQKFLKGKAEVENAVAESNRETRDKKSRKIRGFGAERKEGKGDLGAEEGKKEQDWGQRRGNERHGAFPHQMRSDRSN